MLLLADTVTIGPVTILLAGLACACVYLFYGKIRDAAIRLHYKIVHEKEDIQGASGFLQMAGLPHSAALCDAIVVENWDKAKKEFHTIRAIFGDRAQRTAALANVVDKYIADIKQAGDDSEVERLTGLLGGSAADAAKATPPSGAALQQLAGIFNPVPPGATQQIVHHIPPVIVTPPPVVSNLSHALGAAAAPIAAAAAPLAAAAAVPAGLSAAAGV